MKAAAFLAIAMLAASLCAAPISELKLTNGKVFKNVTILKYETATVTLKSDSGTGPIPYSMIPEPYRAQMMKVRDEHIELERAVAKNQLMIGMTKAQVLRSWGKPDRKTERGNGDGSTSQWAYERANQVTFYAHFDGDRLRSWAKL